MSSNISQSLVGWNCPIHGGFSQLNRCAWPDCPHGVAESSVDASIPGFEKTDAFHRSSWRGQDGGEFHDWQEDELPTWLSLSRAYSHFESNLVKHVYLDRMFHYTSADGALAILQSGCLRFTDYAYLNDTREITYGLDVMRSVLDDDSCAGGSQALTNLKAYIEETDPFSPYNVYTASFSYESDSLSQFRLYGPVALGFETNPIGFGYFKGDSHIGNVVYDTVKQTELIKTFFDLVKQSEEKDAVLVRGDEKKQISSKFLISHLLRIAALFKHPTFSDEREIRLLYSEPLEIMDQFGQDIARRQFRISGGSIIPFTNTIDMISMSSTDKGEKLARKLPLKSVTIGPMAQTEALARGMRDLLSFQGYPDVEVSLSEAPLRS